MKSLLALYLLLFAISSVLSCAGSASGSEGTSNDNGQVTFKINGKVWESSAPGHPELGYEEEAITDNNTVVRVEAFAADGSHFALTVYQTSDIGPGTYPITGTGMSAIYEKVFGGPEVWLTSGMPNNAGSITISSMTDERVTGTFNFDLRNAGDPEDVLQITEGRFDVKVSAL